MNLDTRHTAYTKIAQCAYKTPNNRVLTSHTFTEGELKFLREATTENFCQFLTLNELDESLAKEFDQICKWADTAYKYKSDFGKYAVMEKKYEKECKAYYIDVPTVVKFCFNIKDQKGLHGKWIHYYKKCPGDWKDRLKATIYEQFCQGGDRNILIYNVSVKTISMIERGNERFIKCSGYESDDDGYDFLSKDNDKRERKQFIAAQKPQEIKSFKL